MKRLHATMLAACLLAAAPAPAEEVPGWVNRLSFKGDLRLRYEGIDEDGESSRERARYRARLAMTAAVSDRLSVVMELASGADDPVSRNVTFDGGFTTKDLGFDLAYVDWAFADGWHLYGGKMKNPLQRPGGSGLLWDSDLNPEGVAARYSRGALFATAGVFSVEERSSAADSLLSAVQFGSEFEFGEELALTAGLGYVTYSNTVGNEPFYDGSSNGNSVDVDGNYIYDYRTVEVFAELDTRVADLPLAVFGHWVRNGEADEQDSGYALGARLGVGKADFGWSYVDVEADAVIGTFNDSDFGGGGTDAKGHILRASYPLRSGVSLAGTLFLNEVEEFQGEAHDYTRFQLDVSFAFK